MKELIEIPDSNVIANTEGCFGISFDEMDYQKIIMGGIPIPDNATNGNMIKAMFPDIKIHKHDKTDLCDEYIQVDIWDFSINVSASWWEAPFSFDHVGSIMDKMEEELPFK
jgi:hypothetical protein